MTHTGLPAFARQVHFIEDRVTALERAVDAVEAATGAAWVAVYTPDQAGELTLSAVAGKEPFGAPEVVDADDPALVELRAERTALDGPAESVLAGSVVLPFVSAGGITGLLALGAVPYAYTAAERDMLLAVAGALGLALEVLHVRALRKEVARWRERAEWSERELAVLHRALGMAPAAESPAGIFRDYAPGSDAAGGSLAGNDSASASS